MYEFRMPKLGADMEEGILLEWKIAPGGHVNKGDVVAIVETSKGAIDIEAFVNGTVDSLIVAPGDRADVGTVLARIRTDDDTPAPEEATVTAKPQETDPAASEASGSLPPPFPGKPAVLASPRARRRARQLNVALEGVTGTGPNGSIVAEDIEAAARLDSAGSTASEPGENKILAMRKTIAAAMSRSKREIPHYYLAHDIDVSPLLTFLETWNQSQTIAGRILPALLYYKAIGLAAKEFESVNGTWSDGGFKPAPTVNLGIAISMRGGGLIAPCLMNVANKSAVDLMRELKDLVARSRKGGLRGSEMSHGTITASNLGDLGVDFLAGVIYSPQVALVGIGSMRRCPWAVGEKIELRSIVNFSLAADHRVSDGHTGALFLRRIGQLVDSPGQLMG